MSEPTPIESRLINDKYGLLTAPIKQILPKLTLPMAIGMIAILLFNLIDTFFVAQLGTTELAAVSLTFPVTFSLNCIMLGIGVGLSSLVGRQWGEQNQAGAKRLATHGVLFTVCLMVIIGIIGWLTVDPLFKLLGASDAALKLIHPYMSIWYLSAPLLAIPMVGNNALRATGDTKTPAKIMMTSAVLNALLDPLFIFGLFGFPKLGMTGAAIATAISWSFAMGLSLYVQIYREKLLISPQKSQFKKDVRLLLRLAIPASLSNLINPLTGAVIMALLARLSTDSVAAYGAAIRVESLLLLLMISLSSAILLFMSQNLGAKQNKRAFQGLFTSIHFAWGFQFLLYLMIVPLAVPIAHLFTNNSNVIHLISLYLWLMPLTYGAQGCTMLLMSSYNAFHLTHWSLSWNVGKTLLILLPTVFLGRYLDGTMGVFIAIAATNLISGVAAYYAAIRLRHTYTDDVSITH